MQDAVILENLGFEQVTISVSIKELVICQIFYDNIGIDTEENAIVEEQDIIEEKAQGVESALCIPGPVEGLRDKEGVG